MRCVYQGQYPSRSFIITKSCARLSFSFQKAPEAGGKKGGEGGGVKESRNNTPDPPEPTGQAVVPIPHVVSKDVKAMTTKIMPREKMHDPRLAG